MCKNGGILYQDANAGDNYIRVAKINSSYEVPINLGDPITIFDADTPYELAVDFACVKAKLEETDDYVKI